MEFLGIEKLNTPDIDTAVGMYKSATMFHIVPQSAASYEHCYVGPLWNHSKAYFVSVLIIVPSYEFCMIDRILFLEKKHLWH